MVGIVGFGAYVPQLRLQRSAIAQAHAWFAPGLQALARGERAMACWDEDAITMAVEAARDCFADRARDQVRTLMFASTSAPFADRQNAGVVKEALNLSDEVATLDAGGSQKAATSALLSALHAARGGAGDVLCVAAERPRARPATEAELLGADAAACMLVGTGAPLASFVGGHAVSADLVDHFRSAESGFDYAWESRWVREEGYGKLVERALGEALARHGLKGADVQRLLVPIPVRGVADALARKTGIGAAAVADDLAGSLGHAGAAQPLVQLAHALASAAPGDRIVLVGFGQGCDVLIFQATERIRHWRPRLGVAGHLLRRKAETNYLKFLAFGGLLDLDKGMRAEMDQKQPLTALYRSRKAVLGLVGSRCTATGAVQFPRSEISVASTVAAVGTQEDYPLAERGARILTHTADNLTYTLDPPCYYGMVAFDGGGRLLTEFADADAGNVRVGAPVRMVFRIKARDAQRGFTKYFWKAAPAAAE